MPICQGRVWRHQGSTCTKCRIRYPTPAASQGREKTPLRQTGPLSAPQSALHWQQQDKLQEEKLNSGEASTEEYKTYSF